MSEMLCILVVDDDQMMARTLHDILRASGYQAETAHSGPEALEMLEGQPFDCVLSDIKMPGVSGVKLYGSIKARQPDLPVVLMTAYSTDALVQEGLEAGAIAVLTKPLDLNRLLAFFSSLRRKPSIVIVDDDPHFCRTLGDILRARGFAVAQITDPHAVTEQVEDDGQVILLDMKLNSINGLDVLWEIRKRHPHLPVILVTGYRQEMGASVEAALRLGAYTCFHKPLQIEKLLQALTQIHHRELGRLLGHPARRKR
jgi:two-component system, NtrC family, response regulator HydG